MPVSVESSTTVVVKEELVETCKRYVEAPVTAFHESVSVVGWFVDPFAGVASVGAGGAAGDVVKLDEAEYALVPPAFDPLTCQK